MLWDVNSEGNQAVAEEIKEKGKKAHAYTCDCSKREEIYRVAEEVSSSYRALNCAYDVWLVYTCR